jgi:hypothetical protein
VRRRPGILHWDTFTSEAIYRRTKASGSTFIHRSSSPADSLNPRAASCGVAVSFIFSPVTSFNLSAQNMTPSNGAVG